MKPFYLSKTLWVNLIAGAATFAAPKLGFELDGQTQMSILAVVNIVLRLITKDPVGLA